MERSLYDPVLSCSGHRTSIAHRNISSRNILVKQNGTCALADFSYAVKLEEKRPTHVLVSVVPFQSSVHFMVSVVPLQKSAHN